MYLNKEQQKLINEVIAQNERVVKIAEKTLKDKKNIKKLNKKLRKMLANALGKELPEEVEEEDGECPHCDGTGCVACDATKLNKKEDNN